MDTTINQARDPLYNLASRLMGSEDAPKNRCEALGIIVFTFALCLTALFLLGVFAGWVSDTVAGMTFGEIAAAVPVVLMNVGAMLGFAFLVMGTCLTLPFSLFFVPDLVLAARRARDSAPLLSRICARYVEDDTAMMGPVIPWLERNAHRRAQAIAATRENSFYMLVFAGGALALALLFLTVAFALQALTGAPLTKFPEQDLTQVIARLQPFLIALPLAVAAFLGIYLATRSHPAAT